MSDTNLSSQDYTNSFTFTNYTQGTEGPQAAATNLETYEDIPDTISTFLSSGLDFNPTQVPDGNAGAPKLPLPLNQDQTGPEAYGTLEQKMIKEFFSDQVKMFMQKEGLSGADAKDVYQAIMTGTEPTNGKLAILAKQINSQATQTTIEQSKLPSSWTLQSTREQD